MIDGVIEVTLPAGQRQVFDRSDLMTISEYCQYGNPTAADYEKRFWRLIEFITKLEPEDGETA